MLFTSERIFFVLAGLVGIALCMPAIIKDSDTYLVEYHNERSDDGSYSFNYELSDGQSRTEKGILKDGTDVDGNDIKILSVTGQYSFIAPNGQKFTTFYTADEKGYRVEKMMMGAAEARSLDTKIADAEDDSAFVTTTESATESDS